MMYDTKYLPENFEQCRLEKTILRQFPYNLDVRSSWNALIQDGGKYHEKAYFGFCRNQTLKRIGRLSNYSLVIPSSFSLVPYLKVLNFSPSFETDFVTREQQ